MRSRIVLVVLALAFAAAASAFTPRTGHWYNPAEDGTGYNIDIQDGQMVVTVYSYKPNGDSEWYIATGQMEDGQHSFTGTLNKIRNGPCISCSYVSPNLAGNDGTITIEFSSEISATVRRPGGLLSNIKPLNFGFGDPPIGLLGEWVFVENIDGYYFADHYNFAFVVLGGGTSNGTGLVSDPWRHATCEYQRSGSLAGKVVCFHWSDASHTTLLEQYVYELGLDQTFSGVWISPTTSNSYPMKGHLWESRSGYSKSFEVAQDDPSTAERKRQAERSFAGASSTRAEPNPAAAALLRLRDETRSALMTAH